MYNARENQFPFRENKCEITSQRTKIIIIYYNHKLNIQIIRHASLTHKSTNRMKEGWSLHIHSVS